MKVTLREYKLLQRTIYDGEYFSDLIPLYAEFAEFAGTDFKNPVFVKLLEGLTNIEVEG